MLIKWFKKEENEMAEQIDVSNSETTKSRFKSADIVFGLGVLLIIGGIAYMVRQAYVPEHTTAGAKSVVQASTPEQNLSRPPEYTENSNASTGVSKSNQKLTPPPSYGEYTKHNKPWEREQKAKNIRAKVEENIREKEQKIAYENSKNIKSVVHEIVDIPVIPVLDNGVENDTYTCTVWEKYKKFENKEMLYYRAIVTKGYTEYIPAFDQQKWNEKGVIIKHRFMVSQIDVPSAMVELSPNKWIPALSFAKCVLVEEK